MAPVTKEQPFAETLCFLGTKKIAPVDDYISDGNSDDGLVSDRDENGKVSRRSYPKDQSHIKVRGGKAAAPKPIRADYDDDDARIVELKQMGYSDSYVAEKLIQEGRVRYEARTITTRWQRLRKALEEKEEEMLDDELSDWHDGEDEVLKDCIEQVNAKLEKDIAKLKATMWRKVSIHFADIQQKKKYTAKACFERWESLLNGTADLPIELDPDKTGRARAREARILDNKARRAQAAAELQAIEDEKHAAKLAKARAVKKFKDNLAARAAEKAKEKEIYRQMKASGVAARQGLKKTRGDWLAYMRVEIKWQRTKAKAEAKLRDNYDGGPARKSTKFVDEGSDDDDTNDRNDSDESDDSDEPGFGKDQYDGQRIPTEIDNTATTPGSGEKRDRENSTDSGYNGSNSGKKSCLSPDTSSPTLYSGRKSKSPKPTYIPIGSVVVTTETLLNPRSILTRDELEDLLLDRELEPPADSETHPQIVARLAAEDQLCTSEALGALMGKNAVTGRSGKKQDKILAWQKHNAAESAAGQAGVKSTDLAFKQAYVGYQAISLTAATSASTTS